MLGSTTRLLHNMSPMRVSLEKVEQSQGSASFIINRLSDQVKTLNAECLSQSTPT